MSTSLRTIVFGLGFATLGAVTVVGTQAIAQQGPAYGQGQSEAYGQGYSRHAARTRGRQGPHGPMGRLQVLLSDLDLTEEQQALGQELRAEMRELAESHKGDRQAETDALVEALQADPVDTKAIHRLIDDRQDRQAEMAHAAADSVVTFFETLDQVQQTIVLERIDDAAERMGRGRRALQQPAAE